MYQAIQCPEARAVSHGTSAAAGHVSAQDFDYFGHASAQRLIFIDGFTATIIFGKLCLGVHAACASLLLCKQTAFLDESAARCQYLKDDLLAS
jgi:hypothetical protein